MLRGSETYFGKKPGSKIDPMAAKKRPKTNNLLSTLNIGNMYTF